MFENDEEFDYSFLFSQAKTKFTKPIPKITSISQDGKVLIEWD